MGMPITVEVVDSSDSALLSSTFNYFHEIDERYSTYKDSSEISQINHGLPKTQWSTEMQEIMRLCEETKQETDSYFDVEHSGKLDPSGLVKGWSIWQAAQKLLKAGAADFYIEAGGDIQSNGVNSEGKPWLVGIRNPFNTDETIKTVRLNGKGIATSGTYIRGQHIYNPHAPEKPPRGVQSITLIAANVYEADRFATAAFAMGKAGIMFIEKQPGLEGYMIDDAGIATYTSGFNEYVYA